MADISGDEGPAHRPIHQLETEREALSAQIGKLKARGEDASELIAQSREISQQITRLTRQQDSEEAESPGDAQVKYRTEVLDSAAQVVKLREEWTDLLERSEAQSPFLTWEWMASWYETYENEGAVQCLAVRDADGHLEGIVPLFVSKRRDPHLSRGEVGFASTSTTAWGTDLELIATPQARDAVALATVAYLQQTRREWRRVKLLRMRADSEGVWSLLRAAAGAGLQAGVLPGQNTSVLALSPDTDDVISLIGSSKLRRNCRKALKELHKDHPDHGFAYGPVTDGLEELLRRHVQLNIDRRATVHRGSNFEDAGYTDCFLLAAQRLAQSGSLRIARLTIGARLAASLVCVPRGRTLYLWTSAWDPEFARYAVSHLAFLEAFKGGKAEGARDADFLSDAQNYKSQYTSHVRHRMDVLLAPAAPRLARAAGSGVEGFVDKAIRILRRVDPRENRSGC